MKRSGFTLIELIFVIVIIGVLAAVAVPKFQNLKQNADAANVVKVGQDTFNSVPSAFINLVDLDQNKSASSVVLSDLVNVSGKGWSSDDTTHIVKYIDDSNDTRKVIEIDLNSTGRTVSMDINCTAFADTTTQTKCTNLVGTSTSKTVKF